MINKTINYIFLIFILNFSVALANLENSIVMKVDEQIITDFEIKNKILSNLILSNKIINQKNIDSIKSAALESLISSKIKSNEISKYNLKVKKSKIDQYLNSISSNNIQSLKEKFVNNDLDFELFLNEIKIEFKWQQLIYEIYSKNISIDDAQIENELNKLVKENESIKEYKLSEIEIFLSDNDKIGEKIVSIIKQIEDIGFEKTALVSSSSPSASNEGNLGWINSKTLSKEIAQILNNMKINEISEPIKKQNSVLFLKINDLRTKNLSSTNISGLKENIINQKRNELFNLYSKSHLSKLRNNSLIEYK